MKYELVKTPEGEVVKAESHNNKAPGLLRIFINDPRPKHGKKMADIRKDTDLHAIAAELIGRPVEELLFRFNGNLGAGGVGILVQDAKTDTQKSTATDVTANLIVDTPAAAPEAPAVEPEAAPEPVEAEAAPEAPAPVEPEGDIPTEDLEPAAEEKPEVPF